MSARVSTRKAIHCFRDESELLRLHKHTVGRSESVHCTVGTGQEPALRRGPRRKKKAQPERLRFKNPPKEEVLEECAAASRASDAGSIIAAERGQMQAFSAALQYIVDSPVFCNQIRN